MPPWASIAAVRAVSPSFPAGSSTDPEMGMRVATRSCVTQTSAVKGEITTLEGLAVGGKLHPLQQAWIDEQVPQCGFCQNGQIITAKVLLDKNPNPTDAQIREGMNATLCRCMTYYRVQAAIKRAAATMARRVA